MRREVLLKEDGIRLDKALSALLPDLSRSQIKQLISSGKVLSSGKTLKPAEKSRAGMKVTLFLPEEEEYRVLPEAVKLDVVYEDDYLLVINKPQGMVVHPGPGHPSGTLVNALLYRQGEHLSDLYGEARRGIVHRLDKDSSGLLLAAKDNRTHKALAEAFAERRIERIYDAVAHGCFAEKAGVVDAPIGRDKHDRQKMACTPDGKPAKTYFRVLAELKGASYLQLRLESGRTHQIRVHMLYTGHPLVGDPVYAGKRPRYGLSGQCLHARKLNFIHPVTGEELRLEAPLPDYFKKLLKQLDYDEAEKYDAPEKWRIKGL